MKRPKDTMSPREISTFTFGNFAKQTNEPYGAHGEWRIFRPGKGAGYADGTIMLTRSATKTRKAVKLTLTPTNQGFGIAVHYGSFKITTGTLHAFEAIGDKEE